MIRLATAASLAAALLATPVVAADTKEQSCTYQAQVVAAIQNARLDRVKERDVAKVVAAIPVTDTCGCAAFANAFPT